MANFSKAFSESFDKAWASSESSNSDIMKEKIKRNFDKARSDSLIDVFSSKVLEGLPEEDQKKEKQRFEKMKAIGLEPSQVDTTFKALYPDKFKSDVAQAIQEQTLLQKQQQNAANTLPTGLPQLRKDSTPEEKSAFLDMLPPELATNIQGIANYELDPTRIASLRTGERSTLIAATKMFDPTFDMKKYPAQQQYVKDLADTKRGTVGGIVNSANTLVGHLGFLDEQIEKLKNTNLKPANAIINLAKDVTGDPSITNYEQAVTVVNSEIETLLSGVGVTQEGLRVRDKLLSKNAGYEQMKSAIRTLGHIMQARTHPLEQQYESLFNKPAGDTILHSDSKDTLNRLYGNSSESSKKSYSNLWS